MANARIDDNGRRTITGLLNTDGSTITNLTVNPTTHALSQSDGTTGSDLTGANAKFDANNKPTLIGVSEVDGITPVPVYINSSGQLLVDST